MKLKSIIVAVAFMATPAIAFAQSTKADEQLSEELKNQISILKADIKALKARKKADPKNITILSELSQKQTELKENKRHKKIFDNAISASNKAQKETKQAEKAKEKLEDAMEKRNEL